MPWERDDPTYRPRTTNRYGTSESRYTRMTQPYQRYAASGYSGNTPLEEQIYKRGSPGSTWRSLWDARDMEALVDRGLVGIGNYEMPYIDRNALGGGGGGGWGGGGGGGGSADPNIRWTVGNYTAAGAPDWWRPLMVEDKNLADRPDVAFTMMVNSLIPYLSPEDQVRMANALYTTWGDTGMEIYAPGQFSASMFADPEDIFMGTAGGSMVDESYYYGAGRSQSALNTLAEMMSETGKEDLGPGYRWLQDLLTGVSESGGGRTRQEFMQMLSNVDPLLGQAKSGDLSAFAPLGQAFVNPYFTNFQMRPTTEQGTFGRGRGSKYLYW